MPPTGAFPPRWVPATHAHPCPQHLLACPCAPHCPPLARAALCTARWGGGGRGHQLAALSTPRWPRRLLTAPSPGNAPHHHAPTDPLSAPRQATDEPVVPATESLRPFNLVIPFTVQKGEITGKAKVG